MKDMEQASPEVNADNDQQRRQQQEELSLEEFVSVLQQLPGLKDATYDPDTGVMQHVAASRDGTLPVAQLHAQLKGVSRQDVVRCMTQIFREVVRCDPVQLSRVFPLAKPSRHFAEAARKLKSSGDEAQIFHRPLLPGINAGPVLFPSPPEEHTTADDDTTTTADEGDGNSPTASSNGTAATASDNGGDTVDDMASNTAGADRRRRSREPPGPALVSRGQMQASGIANEALLFDAAAGNLYRATPRSLPHEGEVCFGGERHAVAVKPLHPSVRAHRVTCADGLATARLLLPGWASALCVLAGCKPHELVVVPLSESELLVAPCSNPHSMLITGCFALPEAPGADPRATPGYLTPRPFVIKRLPRRGDPGAWVQWDEYIGNGAQMGYLTTDGLHQFPFPTTQHQADRILKLLNAKGSTFPVARMAHSSALQVTSGTKGGSTASSGAKAAAKAAADAMRAATDGADDSTQLLKAPPRGSSGGTWWRRALGSPQLLLACLGALLILCAHVMGPMLLPEDVTAHVTASVV